LGQYEQALADYNKAIELSPDNASFWNSLCWSSSLLGGAADVLESCERAVELAPDNGAIRDSRGLARALTGDYEGAIADFEFYVAWSKENSRYERFGFKREAWIAELQAGRNPFDEATLQELLKE
jgi:tetratricopeptide (TPR) repeat protein